MKQSTAILISQIEAERDNFASMVNAYRDVVEGTLKNMPSALSVVEYDLGEYKDKEAVKVAMLDRDRAKFQASLVVSKMEKLLSILKNEIEGDRNLLNAEPVMAHVEDETDDEGESEEEDEIDDEPVVICVPVGDKEVDEEEEEEEKRMMRKWTRKRMMTASR